MHIQRISAEAGLDDSVIGGPFCGPLLLPGATETNACGGYCHHVMVRTEPGWRSKQLRKVNLWFGKPPSVQRRAELQEKAEQA
ncbi:hypothetical protein [Mycolicibacterium helvum]|uniref:Uncharacterized protein n=1 Tax=Mycolicibacterium helvum TaxID=1534349 RepID=A0A7I7T1Y3_9MYCO|nr:hypothetical protein [Mycolicibacterium helvum]BBY62225.1 hypothetical protein MHEL_04680 [Mycolicibacterium helvum]